MDISIIINKKHVANVLKEQIFWIGEDANVQVVANLYEHNNSYYISIWLDGTDEIETIEYEDSLDNDEEILAAMENLINENEEYILNMVL
jgi:hypothetical protein